MRRDEGRRLLRCQVRAPRVLALVIVLTVSACGLWGEGGGPGGPVTGKPTITEEQALERVEGLIEAAAGALSPKPRLEPNEHSSDRRNCTDSSDGTTDGRVVVSRSYWLRDVPQDRNGEIARQANQYWSAQGHTIVEATGIEQNKPDVFAHTGDGFRMSIQWSTDGSIRLGSSSPCVWPDGTPISSPKPTWPVDD